MSANSIHYTVVTIGTRVEVTDGAGLFPNRARDVRSELAHVQCACVLDSTLCTPIVQSNTRALPPSPAFERCCPSSRRTDDARW